MLIADGALSSWHINCFLEDDLAPDSYEGVDYLGVFDTPPPFWSLMLSLAPCFRIMENSSIC